MTPQEAQAFDTKFDDGVPSTGSITEDKALGAWPPGWPGGSLCSPDGKTYYSASFTTLQQCVFEFPNVF
jgi:hypothetical protein